MQLIKLIISVGGFLLFFIAFKVAHYTLGRKLIDCDSIIVKKYTSQLGGLKHTILDKYEQKSQADLNS